MGNFTKAQVHSWLYLNSYCIDRNSFQAKYVAINGMYTLSRWEFDPFILINFYAYDTNLLGGSINTIKENTETLLEANRDIGLEINTEKTKYMIMSRYPNSGQNQNIRTANESFENVAKFKYLGTTLINQNDIHDEIKSRLNSGNACYYSVQNLLSSRLI
jgi:hypothetical protein